MVGGTAPKRARFDFGEFDNLVIEGLQEYEDLKARADTLIAEIDADFEDVIDHHDPSVIGCVAVKDSVEI